MTVVYAPQALFGIDAASWGHVLNAAAGTTVVAITAIMGWRVRPAVGVVAVFAILAFGYLMDLTRTARLDVPAAALALLYLEVGWRAVRTGRRRWAIAAGVVFALAVLVKEVAIPLAPVPFLCAVLLDVPWRSILRQAAWTTLFAALGLAPWFLYYAAQTGRVYRVESPAWTLVLVLVAVVLVIVGGLVAARLADRPGLEARLARAGARLPARVRTHGRSILGWGLTILWSSAFLYFFSRISRLKGSSLIQPTQIGLYVRTWVLDLAPVTVFIAIGFVLALVMLARSRGMRERPGMVNALVATICGAPLVLMVIAVGEPPRNYIAQVSTAVVMAAGAWVWAIDRLVARLTRSGARPGIARWGLVAVVGVAVCIGTGAIGARAWVTRAGSAGNSAAAVRTAVDWLQANVPKGTPVAFGSFLGYEMAYSLVGDYPTYQLRHRIATVDPAMPLGFKRAGEVPADDWVAADTAPRNVNEYQAYRAAWVEDRGAPREDRLLGLRDGGQHLGTHRSRRSSPPSTGSTRSPAGTSGPVGNRRHVSIYKLDLDHLALDRSHLYVSPEALRRLVNRLAEDPATSRAAAAALLPRVVVDPAVERGRRRPCPPEGACRAVGTAVLATR